MELTALGGGEAGDGRVVGRGAGTELLTSLRAVSGESNSAHSPVLYRIDAGDEVQPFQAGDHASEVRRVEPAPARQLGHCDGLVGVDVHQRGGLGPGQPQLARAGVEVRHHPLDEVEHAEDHVLHLIDSVMLLGAHAGSMTEQLVVDKVRPLLEAGQ